MVPPVPLAPPALLATTVPPAPMVSPVLPAALVSPVPMPLTAPALPALRSSSTVVLKLVPSPHLDGFGFNVDLVEKAQFSSVVMALFFISLTSLTLTNKGF
uniref:Secreted protein n=1 Tax=Panagrellus redivivus TaxID=6233 RepID=A0A7E4VBA7_PANRE